MGALSFSFPGAQCITVDVVLLIRTDLCTFGSGRDVLILAADYAASAHPISSAHGESGSGPPMSIVILNLELD
jgi:hypothetical protein